MTENKKKQFVDTNIFLYAYDNSSHEKQSKAKDLISHLWATDQGCLSIQVLQEFYVNVTKKIPKPLPPMRAGQIIEDLSCWQLHVPLVEDILEAINIQQRNHLSFWDALIICSAKSLDCKTIWSEDLSSGHFYEGLQILNPFL